MKLAVTIILFLLAFGMVGKMSYNDEKAAEANYCEKVANGTWPDYKKLSDRKPNTTRPSLK